MKQMEDGKATIRDLMDITQRLELKLDDIRTTLNDKYVTKEQHTNDIIPMQRDIRVLVQFRWWLLGAAAVVVFIVDGLKERIFG